MLVNIIDGVSKYIRGVITYNIWVSPFWSVDGIGESLKGVIVAGLLTS